MLNSCAGPMRAGINIRTEWCGFRFPRRHNNEKSAFKSCRGHQQGQFISVVAAVGWSYDTHVAFPTTWDAAEITKADRVLWKRMPRPPQDEEDEDEFDGAP
jgi:hypothetical protein